MYLEFIDLLIFFFYFQFQFLELLERDDAGKSTLKYRTVTMFVPTNEAFQRYQRQNPKILYHIGKILK